MNQEFISICNVSVSRIAMDSFSLPFNLHFKKIRNIGQEVH